MSSDHEGSLRGKGSPGVKLQPLEKWGEAEGLVPMDQTKTTWRVWHRDTGSGPPSPADQGNDEASDNDKTEREVKTDEEKVQQNRYSIDTTKCF